MFCSYSHNTKGHATSIIMPDENTPLLHNHDDGDHHEHFCLLLGIPPFDKPTATSKPSSQSKCAPLYKRAIRRHRAQNITYSFTAALANTLLLAQIVLGALLTALGASSSSYKLITIFGVVNTIIAGLVAYLKSRGQPMRARMFRDELEEVVDEIEDSRTMWLGIKHGVHGYDEIDIEDRVSVRSEVARLTNMYESAVKKYTENNPDLYNTGGKPKEWDGIKSRGGAAGQDGNAAPAPYEIVDEDPAPADDAGKVKDSDGSIGESPATAKEWKKKSHTAKDTAGKGPSTTEQDADNSHNAGSYHATEPDTNTSQAQATSDSDSPAIRVDTSENVEGKKT